MMGPDLSSNNMQGVTMNLALLRPSVAEWLSSQHKIKTNKIINTKLYIWISLDAY